MNLMEKALGCALLISGLILTSGCAVVRAISETENCDPRIVKAFRALPAAEGVTVDLHGSTGIGCTDTVTPSDPEAFVDHYEQAMRNAGWTVMIDGSGVYGRGPSGGLRLDRLEGNDVGVYALSLDEIQSPAG
jgi:hypothetical protein